MMYAIIEIAGQQFKVKQGDQIFVHRLPEEPGKKVEFSDILLTDNDGKIAIGKPFVADTLIKATVLEHVRGDKVIVFKKKRRKGFQKATGHRQDFTKIQIEAIAKKAKPKKEQAEEV